VRKAIDRAKEKNRKSEFYYKLKDLKKQIKVYKSIFNSKTPSHHSMYLKRKQMEVEKKIKKEKENLRVQIKESSAKLI
jgi:hypothetical protein